MSVTKYKDEIISFYNEFLFNSNINDPGSVAWTNRETQHKRFDILFNIGIGDSDSILDLGCGLGHMVDYMLEKNKPILNYNGMDINFNYIVYAIQRHNSVNFSVGEIFNVNHKYDYIIGSGIFTVAMPLDDILLAIAEAYKYANKGLAFNFLNKEYCNIPGFNSFVPDELHSLINGIYNKTKLVTDYLGTEDFTIYIYK
jgi:ubiquinone/menaquinone biosynthesis C-methylase UbiE